MPERSVFNFCSWSADDMFQSSNVTGEEGKIEVFCHLTNLFLIISLRSGVMTMLCIVSDHEPMNECRVYIIWESAILTSGDTGVLVKITELCMRSVVFVRRCTLTSMG